MGLFGIILIVVIVLVIVALLLSNIRVVPQAHAMIIERL